jgi:hypothetical protein
MAFVTLQGNNRIIVLNQLGQESRAAIPVSRPAASH